MDNTKIIEENDTENISGLYSIIEKYEPIKFQYDKNYQVPALNSICRVIVLNKSCLNIIEQKKYNNLVLVNTIDSDMNGTNYEILDDKFYLRTSFLTINSSIQNMFPLNDNDCLFNKQISIIRSESYALIEIENIINFPVITFAPLKCLTKLNIDDYLQTLQILECVFQTAISGNYTSILIGHINNLSEDIVLLLNYCIFKYGHLFELIIFGIEKPSVYEYYRKHIKDPSSIVKIIDQNDKINAIKNNKLIS
jgi:hypothetical protein